MGRLHGRGQRRALVRDHARSPWQGLDLTPCHRHSGEGEDEGAPILMDVGKNEEQYEIMLASARAMVRTGLTAEARALCDACITLFSKCAGSWSNSVDWSTC